MMILTARMKAHPGKLKELSQTLHVLMDRARDFEGFVNACVFQEIEDEKYVCVYMEWETRKEMDRYVGSDGFSVLLGAMNTLTEPQELSYSVVSSKERLDPTISRLPEE